MVDKESIEHVANLARIETTEAQKDYLGGQLSKIIDYIDKLKELEVEGIEPMRGLHIPRNVFREDKVSFSSSKKDILNNSPLCEGDYFKIPKVIE